MRTTVVPSREPLIKEEMVALFSPVLLAGYLFGEQE